ncbi:MAG: DNA polymerase III subunit gamma/tau [Thermodesulfobacteriota bacterium]
MSYEVLARRYRPEIFEEVVGQRTITQTIQNAISQNRVAHAFLFTGARGVGKTSTARILAKALNCEFGPNINPCNQCSTCQEIKKGISIDVIEIDGASNRGIEEVRELRENVRYTPAKSRYKIYIIDEVHMLTREAFNALLKTLEEPPPHIIFIFATTEPHKIPATILSRCQRYDFKRIPLKEILANLKQIVEKEGIQISQRGLLSIAQASEGSMRDAQSLLDQVISYGGEEIKDEDIGEILGLIDQKIILDTLEAIANKDARKCMEMVEYIYHYGYDLQHFCRDLLQSLRNLILIKVCPTPEGMIDFPEEDLKELKILAEKFEFDQLNYLFSLLLKGEEEVSQSTFPRVMLEITLIRMAMLQPLLPIDQILKRLEKWEREHPSIPSMGGIGVQTIEKGGSLISSKETPKKPPKVNGEVAGKEELKKESPFKRSPKEAEISFQEPPDLAEHPPEKQENTSVQDEIIWRSLVDFTREKNPVLGSFLALGNVVQLKGEEIEIGFEKDSFHYDRMLEKENQIQLESICQEFFKKKMRLTISALDSGWKAKGRLISKERTNPREMGETPEEGEKRNSIIEEALRIFKGRIVQE